MKWISEVIAFVIILTTCVIHAKRFHDNIPISKWFHLSWLAIYLVLICALSYITHSWILLITLCVERAIFYNQVLNVIRGVPFFYLHSKSEHGSVVDAILEFTGSAYPYIWAAGVVAFIILQIFL